MAELGRMVESNHHHKIMKSGFVLTPKEINEHLFSEGGNALWWAVKNCNIELAEIFLKGGGDPNSKDNQGNTCMHIAMKKSNLLMGFLLLDYGANLNKKNDLGVTPLYYAR